MYISDYLSIHLNYPHFCSRVSLLCYAFNIPSALPSSIVHGISASISKSVTNDLVEKKCFRVFNEKKRRKQSPIKIMRREECYFWQSPMNFGW